MVTTLKNIIMVFLIKSDPDSYREWPRIFANGMGVYWWVTNTDLWRLKSDTVSYRE